MVNNLRVKHCIVGVGETEYSRASARSTPALAVEAIVNAMADAGVTRFPRSITHGEDLMEE